MSKTLRQEMPQTAAFIDDLREAFGSPTINAAIKAGIDGQPTFYASENGREIGTRDARKGTVFHLGQLYLRPAQPKGDKK